MGIGTSSPNANRNLHLFGSTSGGLRIEGTARGGYVEITDGTNTQYIGTPHSIAGSGNSTDLSFWTAGAERMRVLSGGGLTFNGDTAAANALDDYEEGTFTPSFISGASAITYTTQSGRYTKIGNLVHFQIFLDAASVSSTNSSGVNIGGLPFTSFNGQPLPSYSIGYNNNFHAAGHTLTALGNSNTTTINLYQDDGSSLIGTESNFLHDLYISGSYIAA